MERGEAGCLVTVIASGEPGVSVGAKVLVTGGAVAAGTLGSPERDREALAIAREALRTRKRTTVSIGSGVRVFVDPMEGEVRVLICGAGHIAVPLARFCREAGFAVTVLDDRPEFAHPDRFPGCQVLAEPFVPTLRSLALGPFVYTVVITRGHEHDLDCLREILPKPTAYVGLIGSRRRVGFVLDQLEKHGVPRARLDQVFTPIGIPIGAESPEEIALSIAAEIVGVRRKGEARARALRRAGGMDR
ncbi:MAG: XdhC/CoxI family protein [Deferrisomatales bacterium]